jgi:cytochrome b561
MTRRRFTILLHWSVLLLILIMIKGGSDAPALRWAFVLMGGVWVAIALLRGLLGKPGPKLTGAFRTAYPWMHRGMYALIGLTVVLNFAALINIASRTAAWNSLLVLGVAAIFHSIFHLWRHTSLNDGALRLMTPKFMHKHL